MEQRGRPKTPDILTPREWEVLALLRNGLSNRQIAARLGISYDGARYHVSEILSKLGVTSREEAAVWRPDPQATRRWSMFPQLPVLSGLRELVALAGGQKLAAVGTAMLIAAAAGGYGALSLVAGGDANVEPLVVRAKNVNTCDALFTYQCIEAESEDYSSLEEAVANASFQPSLPSFIPDGFQPVSIRHTRPLGTAGFVASEDFKRGCPGCDPRMSHNDQIGIYFRDGQGNHLALIQGFPATIFFYENTPEEQRGTVEVRSRQAFWVQFEPGDGSNWQYRQVILYWDIGSIGTGWAQLPDGGTQIGSPMSYSITSNSLSVEELVRIAESIDFE